MGHSSKAGENIFWAMNRNKPGIIKRILNALERFIARIRGKDAYLAVEQRQAAERLRDMLTGELKRAYGTEVKGEAAVESDEGKRYSITSDGKVSETASDDTSSIKEQLRNSLDTVNALESVASVEYSPTNKKELKDRAISEFRKIGFVVDRQNFGKIEIGEKQITNSLNYLNTEAEKAALLTVPKVLKRGEIISGHKDHKGRAYSTITIAAPVEINGARGNVAATVRQTGASRYYTHRILLPNGSEFIFAESRKNEEPTFVGMPAANDSQRSTISSSSVNSISQDSRNVNRQFSEISDAKVIEETTERLNEVSKPEKRFSLSSNVEQTKDLIAVHNMTAAELEKSLDLGGLPMPSIAIIKAADGHSEYGDVSLVFGKDTIDPKKSARNKVYGGDAWTPTFPKIEYKANEKVGKLIRDKYYDLSRKYGYDNTRALYNYAQDLSDVLTSEGGEKAMIDKLYGDTGMMQIYLMDTGRERVANVNKETKTALTDGQVRQYENLIDTLGRDEMNGFAKKDGEELSDLVRRRKAFIEENEAGIRKAFEKTFIEDGMSAKDAAEVSAELALSDLRKYVLDTFNYIKNGAETVKTEFDSEATDVAIKKAADGEGYRKWINNLFGGAEEKSGIRNSKDAYTASGNRRSFEALHWENNLENIVKAMLEQDETGGAFFSGSGIWGVSAKKYTSISEIKNDSSRLRTMNEAEYNALKEQYGARMQKIAQTLIDPKNDNYFIASDDAYSLIVDAVRNSKDEIGILRYLKKYNSRATEKTASDIAALVRDIAEMPTGYFEAKPQRAVGFDEVKAVILPDNASGELVSRLESDGINTVTYKAGDENSRLEALNGVRDVRFSLSSADTDIYSRIFDMQREETKLTSRIREIEKSDAFKNANDDLSKAIDSDNIAEGMKAYQAWSKESGYADLVDRRDALRAELEEIRTKANNDAVSKAINEERTAIEKSGLSEADYFRKQAVKEFGYTPYFYDAGYIMPNGKMLNFSGEKGRHYGSRGQDHRAIGTIYAYTNGTDALVRFMNDGNIRIMAETPGLDISASTEPSKEQYTTIRRFANEFSDGGYFAVDFSDENGKTVGTLEYEGNINPTRIVNDIKHFYETGEVREQSGLDRFRYSLTRANEEYMKAVESGDTEEQRRLVDEAAKESGYDRLFWHGSKNGGGFTEFRDWSYFTENKKYASRYAKAGDKGSLYEVYANLGNAFDTRKPECREIFDKMRSEYGLSKVQESGLPDWTDGYDIAEFIDENGLDYDSIILDEGGDLVDGKPVSRGFSYVIRSSEQVKSADPITYDDSGNVIPLTERFDSGNRDIRWSISSIIGDSGKDYGTGVVLDSTLLDNLSPDERVDMVKEYVKELGGQSFTAFDKSGKAVSVRIAEAREKFRNQKGKKVPVNKHMTSYLQDQIKQEAVVLVDELITTAKQDSTEPAHHSHDWLDNNGLNDWDVWKTYIQDKEKNVWEASLQIANASNGDKVLYEVYPIKKVEGAKKLSTTSTDNSVSHNTPVVNTQSMQDVEKDSSDERHSLVKSAQSELKALQKENEKLRQDVDDLKQELQLTHGRKLSRDALISSIQKILIDRYGVKLSAKELYPHVTNLYDMFYNNTVDGKRLKKDERVDTMRIIEEMDKIVDAVIENAVGVDDTYVEMKKLLPELRNTKLVVPMDARADAAQSAGFENWAEFRKANFGRVGFANEGLPVDTYYMELSERYPELFPDGITHPGEQAAHIADVVNTIRESGINEYQLYDIEDERIRTSIKNDVMDIIGNAEKLQTFADRAAQKVEDTKLAEAMHYGADIAKLKRLNAEKVADIKAENRKRLSDMRRKYQDRVESVRERYAEARANRSEKQKQTVLRNKVLRKYTEASSMLDRPTTENHFTEAMREPIMEFLAAVDITTGKSVAKQGVYDRILRVIEAANNMAAEDGKNGLDIAETDLNVQEKQLIVDSGLLERMAAWVEANKGEKLTELSSAQLFDQIVSNEPPVGYVHLDLLQQPYFAADTVRISYEQHTEKNLRLDSRASVILAVIRLADSAGTSFSNTILSQA